MKKLARIVSTSVLLTLFIMIINSLWYAVLMKTYYENSQGAWVQVSRENPSIAMIVLSIFSLSLLMVILFSRFEFDGKRPLRPRSVQALRSSFIFGVLIGLVYVLPTSLYYFGTTHILAANIMVMDVAWHMIEEGLGGILLGFIFSSRLWQ